MLWLAPNELEKLTGRVQSAAQIRWLQRNRVRHFVNANGQVIVLHSALSEPTEQKRGPKLEAVRKAS